MIIYSATHSINNISMKIPFVLLILRSNTQYNILKTEYTKTCWSYLV